MDIKTQHIIDYLNDKLSAKDKISFELLLESSQQLRQEVNDIRFVWETASELQNRRKINTEKNWKELSRRISTDIFIHKMWRFFRNIAAVLLLPLAITMLLLFEEKKACDNTPVEQVELTSANGLVMKVTLPDGSEVWLNSGSTLSYPQRYTDNIRDVRLSGEAYFKVNADRNSRFVVSIGDGLSVNAYGTEFNICAYDDEQTICATLVSGNISFGMQSGDITDIVDLSLGQQARYNKQSGQITVMDADIADAISWKDEKIVFRRAGMKEVARRLSRYFNVDILLDSEELYNYEYSATFTTETLEEILSLLGKTAPIEIEFIHPKQSDDYTFTKRTVIISMKK